MPRGKPPEFALELDEPSAVAPAVLAPGERIELAVAFSSSEPGAFQATLEVDVHAVSDPLHFAGTNAFVLTAQALEP